MLKRTRVRIWRATKDLAFFIYFEEQLSKWISFFDENFSIMARGTMLRLNYLKSAITQHTGSDKTKSRTDRCVMKAIA